MNKHSSRTSLFLIELVLSIFFFIVAATICLQLFVNTFFLSRETIDTNHALLWSQNLAEPFLGGNGDYSIIKKIYSTEDCSMELPIKSSDYLLLCFDKDWNAIPSLATSNYVVFSVFQKDETFAYQHIYIAKSPDLLSSVLTINDITDLLCQEEYLLYQLTVKKFVP